MVEQNKDSLQTEFETLGRNLASLREKHPSGGYVVIRGSEILGVWRDRVDALQAGVDKWGDVRFLVRDLFTDDKPLNFSRDLLVA